MLEEIPYSGSTNPDSRTASVDDKNAIGRRTAQLQVKVPFHFPQLCFLFSFVCSPCFFLLPSRIERRWDPHAETGCLLSVFG